MPEYVFSTGWTYSDYGGCKCDKIKLVGNEIRKISTAIEDVYKLKAAYNYIHDMYADILNETEAAFYIKDDQVVEIQNKLTGNEENHTSDINDCINSFKSSLYSKKTKLVDLEWIDDRYHRED